MKSFPAPLLDSWGTLRWQPFDPDGEMAHAFRTVPPEKGVNRYKTGTSPLGWVLGPSSSYALSADAIKWVDFLLEHGANPDLPLVKKSSPWFSRFLLIPTLRQVALDWGDERLMEVLVRHGVDVLAPVRPAAPWTHRPRLSSVLGWDDISLLERFFQNHPGWNTTASLSSVMAAWQRTPDLAAKGVEIALAHNAQWTSSHVGPLWLMAMRDPAGPWLGWARAQHEAFPLEAGSLDDVQEWRRQVGNALVYESLPGVDVVVEALECQVSPESRPRLAPCLPPGLKTFGLEEWKGMLRLVDWALGWGLPSNARCRDGVPWGLWVVRQAHKSFDSWTLEAKDYELLAWQCLERLLKAGHSPHLKARPPRLFEVALPTPVGPNVEAVLGNPWSSLGVRQGQWPIRYAQLKKTMAFEKALDKRMKRRGIMVAPSRPPSRF